MPRKLPWATGDGTKKEATAPQQPRKREWSPSSDIVDSDLDAVSELPSSKCKSDKAVQREASSSPIPGPLPAKPDVSFMREGFGADDIFMMVEDEFDHTARLFTQHIHAAEYERLKRLHKSRGAVTLANLQRATDGKTEQSRELRIALEQQERAKQRGEARPKAHESETETSEEEDPYMQDPQLAGLMAGTQQSSPGRMLKGFAKAKSNTRVATSFMQSLYEGDRYGYALAEEGTRRQMAKFVPVEGEVKDGDTDEDLHDDLNTTIYKVKESTPSSWAKRESPTGKIRPLVEKLSEAKPGGSSGLFKPFAKPKEEEEAIRKGPGEPSMFTASRSTSDASRWKRGPSATPAPNRSHGGTGSRIAQRLAERQQKLESQPKSSTSKIIQDERPVVIMRKPSAPSQISSAGVNLDGERNSSVTSPLVQRKEIKREDVAKKRRILDDIPTFLF